MLATATPARMSVVGPVEPRPATSQVSETATRPPTKAKTGVTGGPCPAADHHDRDRGTEARPGRDAEQVRVGERVAEDPLVGAAGHGQRPADEERQHDPRGAQRPDDDVVELVHRCPPSPSRHATSERIALTGTWTDPTERPTAVATTAKAIAATT